jgi:putative membrane-bound dehydrogenase-like protein
MNRNLPLCIRLRAVALLACLAMPHAAHAEAAAFKPSPITVPAGFSIEVAAAPPLVGHAMMGCFDERGRLFLAESAGFNMSIEQLDAARPNFIRMLEDTNADGVFDKSTIFADKLLIPNGALWLDGSLYVAEPPGIWRFTDTNNDGVADKREHIAGNVASNGMSSTLHGPMLHPTGRLFWCSGQMGYNLDKSGPLPKGRIAPGTFWLKQDGTEHEIFSVGGRANPVEVTFSTEGEVFGTVAILDNFDGQRHDALMHWIYGGVYDHNPNDPVKLKRAGDDLPPLSHVGQVAPAGVARYRGAHFGAEYRDNIFWAQFNTHKVIRTRVTRHGATFKSQDEDFLVSTDLDFHATDVIEDADGSLLVIDTGGWFRHGCPTSQIAKPDVKGAIYRVRRNVGVRPEDPWGMKIAWSNASTTEIGALLGDARPAVEDRAIATLVLRGVAAVGALRNAVWTLARMNAPAIIRDALADKDASVRQSAANALGEMRDAGALDALCRIVATDGQPSIRREAAAALGRIGKGAAVPALLQGLRIPVDEFLTQSLIYALIQVHRPELTIAGLSDESLAVRRGALMALSQMDGVRLSREQFAPLLRSDDPSLLKAAFRVAGRDAAWMSEMPAVFREHLSSAAQRSEAKDAVLLDAIVTLANDKGVQSFVVDALADERTTASTRALLLSAMARWTGKSLPAPWENALGKELTREAAESRMQAITLVQQRGIKSHDDVLKQLVVDGKQSMNVRLAALNVVAPRLSPVSAESFEMLRAELRQAPAPSGRLAAARTLASLRLDEAQLERLAGDLGQTDAMVLPALMRAFPRNTSEKVGLALVAGLQKSTAARNLPVYELSQVIQKYPQPVHVAARPLMKQLGADPEQQQKKLEDLSGLLNGGDFSRGKEVFFGSKALCATCHRVHGQGGLIGPNLTTIADIRTGRDLLESLVYPSASIVQSYEPFIAETNDGQVASGLIVRQTPDEVVIRGADLAENRIPAGRIKSLQQSPISIMPQGLDAMLTRDELRDLLAYLQRLKAIKSYAPDQQ